MVEVYTLHGRMRKFEKWILAGVTVWLLICNIGYTRLATSSGAKVETTPSVPAGTLEQIKSNLSIGEKYSDEAYGTCLGCLSRACADGCLSPFFPLRGLGIARDIAYCYNRRILPSSRKQG
jgi:hypothetical protein